MSRRGNRHRVGVVGGDDLDASSRSRITHDQMPGRGSVLLRAADLVADHPPLDVRNNDTGGDLLDRRTLKPMVLSLKIVSWNRA